MSYVDTITESRTFTETHARHMAAKVAADLKRIQRLYEGKPSDLAIANYEQELILLLKAGYLDEITYGYRRDGKWIEPTVRYKAKDLLGGDANDDDPGRIRQGANINGASFYSFLSYSSAWVAASQSERDTFRRNTPIDRGDSPEPAVNGYLSADKTYSAGQREELLMSQAVGLDQLFERRINYPDPDAQERLARLVGLDDHKARLAKVLGLLVNPAGLEAWGRKHHPNANGLMTAVLRRPPLVVLAGDVGSGKTELAETIGDAVARQEGIDLTLFPLSLSSRGQGRVGEMTQLLSAAFNHVITEATKLKSANGKSRGGVILLVDEADSLAQSRETAQMHHEDRAGVNAFIRGIDRVGNARLPAAVIMCTNRLGALDPAVKRRAADILVFERPNEGQRKVVLGHSLGSLGLSGAQIETMVKLTGPVHGRKYGFTFSDLMQRLLPAIVLDAYPRKSVTGTRALEIAEQIAPTPPFQDKAG